MDIDLDVDKLSRDRTRQPINYQFLVALERRCQTMFCSMLEWYSLISPDLSKILMYSLLFRMFPITQSTLYFQIAVDILQGSLDQSVQSLKDTVSTSSFTSLPRILGELVSQMVRLESVWILFSGTSLGMKSDTAAQSTQIEWTGRSYFIKRAPSRYSQMVWNVRYRMYFQYFAWVITMFFSFQNSWDGFQERRTVLIEIPPVNGRMDLVR